MHGEDDILSVAVVCIHYPTPTFRLGSERQRRPGVSHQPGLWLHHLFHSGCFLYTNDCYAGHVLPYLPCGQTQRRQAHYHRVPPAK